MKPGNFVLSSVFCLLSFLAPITVFAKMPDDAIVRIVATLNTGVPSVGTGTVISPDGHILTCYHVIRDAKIIDISFAKRQDDLQAHVISIAPGFDLALLQLEKSPIALAFLPPKDLDPSVFVDRATSFGYPANFSYSLQRIAVDAINSEYTSSGELRTDDGKEKLFTDPDRDLITFISVVNNGASGSPLLFNGSVVGVISGSWSIRGSGAWAIPMIYLSKLRPPTAAELIPGHWPAMNLLKNNAEYGRSSVNLSAPVIIALGRFSDSLKQLKSVCSPLLELVPHVNSMLKNHLDDADAAVQKYGGATLASAHPGVPGISMDLELLGGLAQLAPCARAFNDVHADGIALTERVNDYSLALTHLPPKEQPRDPALLRETKDHVRKLTDLVDTLNNADRTFVYTEPDTATIADYQAAFRQDVQFMKDKDPAGLYTRTVAELDAYYGLVNRLVDSK